MTGFKIISKTEQLDARPTFTVLYGLPGTGKTSTSFTALVPLHFDFDQGIARAVQKIRPDSVSVDDYGQFWNYIQSDNFETYIKENGYKTVVLDTIGTMLEDYATPWLIKTNPKNGTANGGLSLSGWGSLSVHFNAFRNRLKELGLEIVAICHAKEMGDDSQYRLSVKGGSSEIIYRIADMIGFVHVIGQNRIIDFNPTQGHIGKNMAGFQPITVPPSDTKQYDTFLFDLNQQVKERMLEQSNAQIEFNKQLDTWREKLRKADKPAIFDGLILEIKDVENQLLKKSIKALLGDALKQANCWYDKEEEIVKWKEGFDVTDEKEEAPTEEVTEEVKQEEEVVESEKE